MTKLRFFLVSLFVLLFAVAAMAQIQNGQFAGTVTDPSGAAVANARITITNQGTGLSVNATSNAAGAYQVSELPPGAYKITIEAAGFKTFSDVGVTLNAGSTAHVDAKMTLGQTREVVEVTGEASQVNTEEAKLATTVSTTQIENLPLNGRNVYDLMQLSPGAVNVNGVDFEGGHGTVVNGLREDFNGFLINGVANKGLRRRQQHPNRRHSSGIPATAAEHVRPIRQQRGQRQQPGHQVWHQLLSRQRLGVCPQR